MGPKNLTVQVQWQCFKELNTYITSAVQKLSHIFYYIQNIMEEREIQGLRAKKTQ